MGFSKIYKVLLFGYNQTNFLVPIYNYIIEREKNPFKFYAYHVNLVGHSIDELDGTIITESDNFRKDKLGILKSLLNSSKKTLYKEFVLAKNSHPSRLTSWAKKWALKENYEQEFRKYDIIHVHFCHPDFMQCVIDLPKTKKLICSVWGSDILKQDNAYAIYNQKLAFRRADIITIQTAELRQILINKYGQELAGKIEILQFGIPQKIFDNITQCSQNSDIYKYNLIKLGIDLNKTKIVIGSNRSINNNHLSIIRELGQLSPHLTRKIQFILPFGYGNVDQDYLHAIREELNICELDYIIIDNFLINEELATLRYAADIYIHLPETDALSATLAEFLFAGALCITGNWLPYNFFKLNAFESQLITLNNMQELSNSIESCLTRKLNTFPINHNLEASSEQYISPKWEKLYYKLIND